LSQIKYIWPWPLYFQLSHEILHSSSVHLFRCEGT
jgi:hypothetical protein